LCPTIRYVLANSDVTGNFSELFFRFNLPNPPNEWKKGRKGRKFKDGFSVSQNHPAKDIESSERTDSLMEGREK